MEKINGTPGINTLASIIAVLFVLFSYLPMLNPIIDKSLSFTFGDMSAAVGDDSALTRSDFTFNTFAKGTMVQDWNRAMFLEWISVPVGWFGGTDSQVQSILMLVSLLIGSLGIHLLIRMSMGSRSGSLKPAAMNIILIPFYFLNLWSATRLGHNWIWMAYAIFPFFIFCGIAYLRESKPPMLVLYCLTLIFYGMIPHSLIYMLILHGMLVLFALIMPLAWTRRLAFIGLPMLIYLIASIPLLLIGISTSVSYPYSVDNGMAWVLSNNGIMIRTLTAANDWWPQIPYENIRDDIASRASFIAIIAGTFIICAYAFPRLGRSDQWLVALSLLGALAAVFIAQGMNNSGMAFIVDWMQANGAGVALGPFREWARISIMVPIFLFVPLMLCISSLKKEAMAAAVAAILMLMIINIACSPSWEYLNGVYSAVKVPQEYYELGRMVSPLHKNIFIGTIDKQMILGSARYSWNTSKILSGVPLSGVGNGYMKDTLGRLTRTTEVPQSILDTLDIKYVIKTNDSLGGSGYGVNYEWLGCKDLGYFKVCENRHNISRFNVYSTAIRAEGNAREDFGLFFLNQTSAAVSSVGGPQNGYVLLNDPDAYLVQQAKDEYKAVVPGGKWKIKPVDGWKGGDSPSKGLDEKTSELNTKAIYSDKKGARMWKEFDSQRSGRYEVFVNALKSEGGGSIRMIVGDLNTTLRTADAGGRFIWSRVGNATLQAGRQNITVINDIGTNAVEEIVLIPADDIAALENDTGISGLLPMFVLEAEKDFSTDNPGRVESLKVGRSSSGGELLQVNNDTTLRTSVEILEDADFMLALKGQGEYSIAAGGQTFNVSSPGLDFSYSGPFHLHKGSNSIAISARKGAFADVAVIYAAKHGETIETVFETQAKPAIVLDYGMISPTRWDARIDAAKPFLLSFAESYGSKWEARVYKDGVLKETVPSSMLFDTMNGFWINTTGKDIDVRIVFTPQELFESTLPIPICVILGCTAYLGYSFLSRKKMARGAA